jgi:long-chain acyl-CoA synthetase
MNELDTLPKNLAALRSKYGERKVAVRQKDMGIWISYTWEQSYRQVRRLCLGLLQLAWRGEKSASSAITIRSISGQLAIQAGGGVAGRLYRQQPLKFSTSCST